MQSSLLPDFPDFTDRQLLRRARRAWEDLGYIPHQLGAELRKRGYSTADLDLQFSLGAQS